MNRDIVHVNGIDIEVFSLNTVIVGSGAAGLNAADSLYSLGQKDIAIVTEGLKMGTSRNTGSDKQTYYKLTLSGDAQDSVLDMARTLFEGGCMHGDIALVEAALSARCFFKLVDIGVAFPHNRYGEYVGYKTDHDPKQRATSAGPLTSRFMTECLEKQVLQKGIQIFDGYQVIGILTDESCLDGEIRSIGLIALNMNKLNEPSMGLTIFNCTNIVYATGGPAGMYLTSVYPESQMGATGIAFEAGVKGVNLTESQYGIASVKFRWNLSGTYQQAIPRYVSTDMYGNDEREFLNEYYSSPGKMMDAIFLKGYQWPFDPRKITDFGSSMIDILVYNETQIKGRRVFLDYTQNPKSATKNEQLDFSLLSPEAYTYLGNSGAIFGTPIQRLQKMNQPAIDLYKGNGIDLSKEYLEIAVCAQHNNGGLVGNIWWESNVRHFFPVGEANGTFGVYRPGGSALNSTQVGSIRAAQYIAARYSESPLTISRFIQKASKQIDDKIELARAFAANISNESNARKILINIQQRMTKYGAHIRTLEGVEKAISECLHDMESLVPKTQISGIHELPFAFRNMDLLVTQLVYLSAIREYILKGGKSRGSYLIHDEAGVLPIEALSENFRFSLDNNNLTSIVCEMEYKDCVCIAKWKAVRPIPCEDDWFENIWNAYRKGDIITN